MVVDIDEESLLALAHAGYVTFNLKHHKPSQQAEAIQTHSKPEEVSGSPSISAVGTIIRIIAYKPHSNLI